MKNTQIMKTISTGDITSGLLAPGQADKFIQQTFEKTALGGLIRKVMKREKTGEVDKIGIDSRILRAKTEDTDDGYRGKPKFSDIKYATTAVRLPWEITGESLRENIEGENFEKIVADLMTTQLGIDLEDLYLNGDESVDSGDPDYDFLKLNDGWLKQLETGSHIEDRTDKDAGGLSLDVFYDAVKQIPNKYNDGSLRWLMAPSVQQDWERYLLNENIKNGGGLSDSIMKAPASIPSIGVPSMPTDKIILTNPQNLIVVNTYNVQVRKTTEGKEAIMKDKRFYVVHLDFDAIIEEKDAAVLIKGLK